jgi:hypothetical protein
MSTVADAKSSRAAGTGPRNELRVSAYDNVASLLIAALILVGATFVILLIIFLGMKSWSTQVAIPVELLEYAGRGDHAAGFERDMEEPGLEEMEEMIEPQVEAALEAVTDVVSTQAAAFDAIDMAATASKGEGGMGDSRGPGPLGEGRSDIVPPWERWEIQFTTAGIDAYASQLDAFDIELGAAGGAPKIDYAYNLSKATPDTRTGAPEDENRLYMSWQQSGGPLARFDRQLLERAGIKTQRRLVLQFYPDAVEKQLLRREVQAAADAGKTDPRTFLKTIFGVQGGRGGYDFYVIDQYFRPPPAM